jgi:hypothetical protein
MQLGPWPWRVVVLAKIRRARRGSWPGKVWERLRGSPWLDLRAWMGQGGARRRWLPVPAGSGGRFCYPGAAAAPLEK